MTEEIKNIIDSPYTSYWLRKAIWDLLAKDPLDARADAKLLFDLMDQKVKDIFDKETGDA
jgi:hypothetical protein